MSDYQEYAMHNDSLSPIVQKFTTCPYCEGDGCSVCDFTGEMDERSPEYKDWEELKYKPLEDDE